MRGIRSKKATFAVLFITNSYPYGKGHIKKLGACSYLRRGIHPDRVRVYPSD